VVETGPGPEGYQVQRTPRAKKLAFEPLEPRALPSSLPLLIMVQKHQQMIYQVNRFLNSASLLTSFPNAPSNSSLPNGQVNQVINPTGVPTSRESRRETYHASFIGQYTVGPGRFSTESSVFYFRGVGRSTSVLHNDIQIRIINPTNRVLPSTGVAALFDRNLDSNSDLGYDLYALPSQVDKLGRPVQLTIYSLDVNISAGNYVEGSAQGTMSIHYGPVPRTRSFAPSSRALPGARSQGTASVVINAQLYGMQVAFALRNVDYNP